MMTQIPTPQRTSDQKLKGEFYPLQKQELIALKQAKLINNTAYVHFALRYENPFCDRPIEVIPKEFALRWAISESNVYKAIAKLKKLGIIKIKSGKLALEWTVESKNPLPDPASDCQIRQTIARSGKPFSDPANDCQIRQNQSPNRPPEATSDSLQTLQTIQTLQTEAEEVEKFSLVDDPWLSDDAGDSQGEGEVSQTEGVQEVKAGEESLEESGSQETEVKAETEISRDESSQNVTIPQDLLNKLEELGIPLDAQVRKAIASHDISQAYGAGAHVEKTWETINNPRSVFLYQIPRQPVEKRKLNSLSAEFLEWYGRAIADGIVEDIPPNLLSRDYQNQPLVRLKRQDPMTGATYTVESWRRVRDGETDYATPEQMQSFFEQMREKIGEIKSGLKPRGGSRGFSLV
jgi:hypothetical protein